MSLLRRALAPPSYGYTTSHGLLYVPTKSELFREFFSKLNILKTRKNWLSLWSWTTTLALTVPFFIFIFRFFSFKLLAIGFVYSMVGLGTYGTLWFHRYGTHRAYTFTNPIWKFFVRNLAIKIVPEEVYIISHHVHHNFTELPGDPYNVHGGWLYCFLADVNHQGIAQDLSEKNYAGLKQLLSHTGMQLNSYARYQRWGTLCNPLTTVVHFILNWAFWYGVFYLIGGTPLAVAIFGMAAIWAVGIRTYNFEGHGAGKDKRAQGIDFHTKDLSINQWWPGFVAGEWHNNHHLFPHSARSGFLPYQIDSAWFVIRFLHLIGGVNKFRDSKADFMKDYHAPYAADRALKPLVHDLSPAPSSSSKRALDLDEPLAME